MPPGKRAVRASTSTVPGSAQKASNSHELELQYREACHQVELVAKDEEARRLKLQILKHRDENAVLQDAIAQKDAAIDQWSEECQDARERLEQATQQCQEQEKKLRLQARDHANLKTELQSLNGVSQDSTKLLAEKLALSREIALLKPEMEHLRSQLAHQKDVLAEKLALERQLNTLEVELANERRAAKRAAQRAAQRQDRDPNAEEEVEKLREKLADTEQRLSVAEKSAMQGKRPTRKSLSAEADSSAELEEVKSRLAKAEKQLAVEKKERERLQKENQRITGDALEQHDAQEKKLARMKIKLQETQEELKQARGAGARPVSRGGPIESDSSSLLDVTTTTQMVPVKDDAPRRKKRRADEMEIDAEPVQTPNKGESKLRRLTKKRSEAAIGEKSTFSITPFLNRTVSQIELNKSFAQAEATTKSPTTRTSSVFQFRGANDSVENAGGESLPLVEAARPLSPKRVEKAPAATKTGKPRGRPKKALSEASAAAQNVSVPAVLQREPTAEPTIDSVMADASATSEQENRPALPEPVKPALFVPLSQASQPQSSTDSSSQPEPKKKKRKLLGAGGNKTIFDDDNNDDGERVIPSQTLKRQKSVISLGGGGGAGGALRKMAVKMGMGGMGGGFGGASASFSPLKREKRGVNASFLA